MAEHEEVQKTKQKKPDRKKKLYAVLLAVAVVAGASAGGYWWYLRNQPMDATTKYWFDKMAKDGTLEGKAPQEVQGMLNAIVAEGQFNVSLNARTVFEDGSAEGLIGIENISENRYYCRVTLRRDEDGLVLYESKGIKPGQYIDKIKLKSKLPAGEYSCTAQFIATDPETYDDIGQAQVQVKVVVLN